VPPVANYLGLWQDPVAGGGILISQFESTAGMSGGPMLWPGERFIGTAVGSPCYCGSEDTWLSALMNWSAALTRPTLERITGSMGDLGAANLTMNPYDMYARVYV
jgi:hypothetical protein